MKPITPSKNAHSWPRHKVTSIEARKRDLIVRIADWSKDREEPAYDVEVYIGGVYDWNESKTCTKHTYSTLVAAKLAAKAFAAQQIERLL